ncbi:MAG: RnfABCDGE type electron transport complex subunit G [Clostridia bacterium]|nr:RnfABCDGE type electron transport complex subunit G [Clostridia bacterium]
MENKNNFFARYKEIIIPTVVMICICLVITAALAGTNLLTESKIEEIKKTEQEESRSEVLKADKYDVYDDLTENEEYVAFDEAGNTAGYIFVNNVKGYGGEVKVMTGIKVDGTISAVKVLDATSETPGLGQNTGKADFYDRYSGLSTKKEITVVKSGASKDSNSVNAVTGATISSKAVTKAVNEARERFNEIMENEEASKDE